MSKAKLKTTKTKVSVDGFLNAIKDEQKRKDCFLISETMQHATGEEPKMWGSAIIGFGDVTLKYESGRELDWFKIGFSPRKQNLVLYGLGVAGDQQVLLKKLGKYTTGKGCLYINKLEDVD
ncbi:MAG: DUF1801 domain-containing protein, partial [Bacteroidetes bacterium]|nr:DUF1801 domain-containing protein [Bacteroidota bacterium]